MGIYDEVVLDETTRKYLGKYAREGVFQTKYQMTEEGYIRAYDFLIIGEKICCSIMVDINLLIKPKPSFICEEPLLRKLKLEEIGTAEKVEATASTTIYFDNYQMLAELLEENGYKLEEKNKRYDYHRIKHNIARLPLDEETHLILRKLKIEKNKTGKEEDDEEDLLSLLKRNRILILLDNGEYGVALPPGALIEVNLHTLEIYLEEEQKRPYMEEIWIKNNEKEPTLQEKIIIEHQYPENAKIEAKIVSKLDDKTMERIDEAVSAVSSIVSKILAYNSTPSQ